MKLLVISVCTLFFLVSAAPLKAHEIQYSNDVSVFLHLTPTHDPEAGQSIDMHIVFAHKGKDFDVGMCDCVINIMESGKDIFTKQLTPTEFNNTSVVKMAFPENEVYKINISGSPRIENEYEDFSVTFDVKVGAKPGTNFNHAQHHALYLILFGCGIAIALFGIIRGDRTKKTN